MRILIGKNQIVTYILGLVLVLVGALSVAPKNISYGISQELISSTTPDLSLEGFLDIEDDIEFIFFTFLSAFAFNLFTFKFRDISAGLGSIRKLRLQFQLLDIPPPAHL